MSTSQQPTSPGHRNLLLSLFAVIAIFIAGYSILLHQSPDGRPGAYQIDIAKIRKLALSNEAQLPQSIDAIEIAEGKFPTGAVVAGRSLLTQHPMTFAAYRVNYAQYRVMIDTGMDRSLFDASYKGQPFFDDNYSLMQKGLGELGEGGFVLFTHEHPDHIGGLAKSDHFSEIAKSTKLTTEQLNQKAMQLANIDDQMKSELIPYDYNDVSSPAPGIVLFKAAGHSPGSQMIYVMLQNGHEFLFVGDVAWDQQNIETGIGRPLLVSLLFLHEDRQAVADQLVALRVLQEAEPNLTIVVSHDAKQLQDLRVKKIVHDF